MIDEQAEARRGERLSAFQGQSEPLRSVVQVPVVHAVFFDFKVHPEGRGQIQRTEKHLEVALAQNEKAWMRDELPIP